MRVLVQMDPLEGVDIQGDSSFRLMLEAQQRGHTLHVSSPDDLSWSQDGVRTVARAATVRDQQGDHCDLGAGESVPVAEFDVVLLRQDPPFDMHYTTSTHLLEAAAHNGTLVVNDPFWVRNCPEKLFVTTLPDLLPPTLITRSWPALRAFRAAQQDIIVKPLYGNGGEGVFRLRPDDTNFNPLIETLMAADRAPLVAQRFVGEVLESGDRRLILVDGTLTGVILRKPPEGETRSNLHVGGTASAWEPDARDREIAARVGPELRERGLIFAGLDVIGDLLTEINVTSPTGIRELERLSGVNAAAAIWEAIEKRCQSA